MKNQYVYILASRRNGTLYVGLTNNLMRRREQHWEDGSEFTAKYGVKTLVYYEVHHDRAAARQRERSLKVCKRAWKLDLIESMNPDWKDLSTTVPYD